MEAGNFTTKSILKIQSDVRGIRAKNTDSLINSGSMKNET